MANYLTTDTDLAAVANAIREKGGTAALLSYPDGFVDAIEAIEAGSVSLQSKSVTPTKSAQTVTADSGYDGLLQVNVDAIPSQFIIPSGTLLINENGTEDVSQFANVNVNVPPVTSYTLLGTAEFTVSTTSTTATNIGTFNAGSASYTKNKILYIRVRDKAGVRSGYFYGSDSYYAGQSSNNSAKIIFYNNGSNITTALLAGSTGYGIFPYTRSSTGVITMRSRYNSNSSKTIDGTYVVEAYLLDWPDGISPFGG